MPSGARVPEGAKVTVDGEALRIQSRMVHYLVNKPNGVVCTNYDQSGRTRVIDLVPQDDREHLFPVGRLDLSSEGLIIVTNDGELANQLTHPKFGVEKTYLALIAGRPEPGVLQKLRQGVHLAEGVARCVSVYVKKEMPQSTLLEIVLNEGKNREIRRILAKVGHKVLTLKRTAIGDVTMRGLKPGEFRPRLGLCQCLDRRFGHARPPPFRERLGGGGAKVKIRRWPQAGPAWRRDRAAHSPGPRRFRCNCRRPSPRPISCAACR